MTGLSVPTEPEQWFPKDHMFQQYNDLGLSKVLAGAGSANALTVNIVWSGLPHIARHVIQRTLNHSLEVNGTL